jgi:DNA-binding LytR/AlgR family response regulator
MISTLIIEDEEPAALRLEKLLLELDKEIKILDKLDSVEACINWFNQNQHPDLLLLDIQLADGLSFEIFKKVKVESFVIFTTAYDDYAIKAFELNSIDYLLKPVSKEKLAVGLNKFRNLKTSNPVFTFEEIISAIEGKKATFKKRFAISIGNKIKSVETKDVSLFLSQEKNTFLKTFTGSSYPVDFSLDRLETLLDPEYFFRVSRQCLVNYLAINNIIILSKSRIELSVSGAEESVLVSTAKTHSFRKWLDR